jgi:two-component system alkaline phosphatase synthesis response regulator PhoP
VDIGLQNFEVKVKSEKIDLTEKEKDVLKALLARPGEPLAREQLLDIVWNDRDVEYGNVDVHIRHLREKIETDPDDPKIIKTVKGAGYVVEVA